MRLDKGIVYKNKLNGEEVTLTQLYTDDYGKTFFSEYGWNKPKYYPLFLEVYYKKVNEEVLKIRRLGRYSHWITVGFKEFELDNSIVRVEILKVSCEKTIRFRANIIGFRINDSIRIIERNSEFLIINNNYDFTTRKMQKPDTIEFKFDFPIYQGEHNFKHYNEFRYGLKRFRHYLNEEINKLYNEYNRELEEKYEYLRK